MINAALALLMGLVCFGQILSLVSGNMAFIVLRDALFLALGALFLRRSMLTTSLKLVLVAGLFILPLILVEGLGSGRAHPSQMYLATRNALTPWFVAILACIFAQAGPGKESPPPRRTFAERILLFALVYVAIEFMIIRLFPGIYALYDTAVTVFLERKGVDANAAAGLLADYRARTSLLNPVQGCWLFLVYFLFFRTRGLIPLFATLAVALATVTKVALVALAAYSALRTRAASFMVPAVFAGLVAAPLVVANGAAVDEHLNSVLFRVTGLQTAFEQLTTAPFGVGLLQSGVIGAAVHNRAVPGMESGLGVIVSAFGLAGIAYLLVLLAVLGSLGRTYLAFALVLLIGIISSENVMVIYLYAPLLLALAARQRAPYGTAEPAIAPAAARPIAA